MTRELFLSIALFAGCHAFGWFGNALQFMSRWWADRPLFTILLFSVPTGACAYYAMRAAYQGTGSLWSARWLGFGVSWLVFPLLTWAFMSESMFTPKTMICAVLGALIMVVQVYG